MSPDGVWNCQKILPLSLSTAMNSPVSSPVKTRPPAVTSVPAQFGLLNLVSHLALPVIGSIALSAPRMPSAGKIFSMVTARSGGACDKPLAPAHHPAGSSSEVQLGQRVAWSG